MKNFYHQGPSSGVVDKILFRVESHVFAGEEFESKWRLCKFLWLKLICFSEYLKHILVLWNALKPFTQASAQKQSRDNKSFGGRQSSHSYAWMTPRASKSTHKQIISARVRLGAIFRSFQKKTNTWSQVTLDWTRLTYHIKLLWVIGFIEFVQSVAPRKIPAKNNLFACWLICLLSGSFVHENFYLFSSCRSVKRQLSWPDKRLHL